MKKIKINKGKIKLLYRDPKGEKFHFHQEYPTYEGAVRDGQMLFGHGQFLVDTAFVPTRDQQLLRTTIESLRGQILNRL